MRKVLLVAESIQSFLEDHVKKLRQNWFFTLRGNIETYANNPTDQGAFGSVTITKGVKVTASAYYNHVISQFHSCDELSEKDVFMFSYQIKIIDDSEFVEPFFKC